LERNSYTTENGKVYCSLKYLVFPNAFLAILYPALAYTGMHYEVISRTSTSDIYLLHVYYSAAWETAGQWMQCPA